MGMSRVVLFVPLVAVTVAGALLIVLRGRAISARYEEPAYRPVSLPPGASGFELRQYEGTIVAETIVDADLDRASYEAFNRLAGYIFGKNRGARSIAMTAPVSQDPVRISMTTPVSTEPTGEAGAADAATDLVSSRRYRITFTMPRSFTLDTLPEPVDPRVALRREPGRRFAVIRYSGRWTDELTARKTRELSDAVDRAGLVVTGPPRFARYNDPFTPPWWRRNEIMLPVRP